MHASGRLSKTPLSLQIFIFIPFRLFVFFKLWLQRLELHQSGSLTEVTWDVCMCTGLADRFPYVPVHAG